MIEDFIHKNKHAFEENLPKGHVERFNKKLGNYSATHAWSTSLNRMLVVAAVVVVIVTIGFVGFLTNERVIASEYLLENITPELYETETYYHSEISYRMEILSGQNEIDKTIIIDLEEIDKSFDTIKKDLDENPGDERLISAVLNTYQIKLDLLNDLIAKIN